MNTAPALVSVYIATHNRPKMLRRALNSVYAQHYPNIEIIVVDDGSEPSAEAELADDIANGTIHFLRNQTPQGACHARNRAIFFANGEYITGLDDDDEFTPERITNLVGAFENADRPVSCVSSCITEQTLRGQVTRQFDTGWVSLTKLLHYNYLGNQVLTKTHYLREIGGFDETMPAFQDFDTWLRLVEAYGPGLKISDPSYLWHTAHEATRISGSSAKRIEAYNRFIKKHAHHMTPSHRSSMELVRKKVYGEGVGFRDAVRLINRYNATSVLAQLVNHRLKPIKRLINKIRSR